MSAENFAGCHLPSIKERLAGRLAHQLTQANPSDELARRIAASYSPKKRPIQEDCDQLFAAREALASVELRVFYGGEETLVVCRLETGAPEERQSVTLDVTMEPPCEHGFLEDPHEIDDFSRVTGIRTHWINQHTQLYSFPQGPEAPTIIYSSYLSTS